jgi:hypothetical protein
MEVSGQLNAPAALLPENNAGTHRIAGWVGSIAGLNVSGEEKYVFAVPEFRDPDCPAPSIVAIPTTLLLLEGDFATTKKNP